MTPLDPTRLIIAAVAGIALLLVLIIQKLILLIRSSLKNFARNQLAGANHLQHYLVLTMFKKN